MPIRAWPLSACPQPLLSLRLLPQVHLGQIFRQAEGSAIVTGAHEIIAGKSPAGRLRQLSFEQLQSRVEAGVRAAQAEGLPSFGSLPSRGGATGDGGAAGPAAGSGAEVSVGSSASGNACSSETSQAALNHVLQQLGTDGVLVLDDEPAAGSSGSGSGSGSGRAGTPRVGRSLGPWTLSGSSGNGQQEGVTSHEVGQRVARLVELLGQAGVDLARDVQVGGMGVGGGCFTFLLPSLNTYAYCQAKQSHGLGWER